MWTSVADLFLFVRQSRSVIALDTTVPARILNRLKDVVRGESKVRALLLSIFLLLIALRRSPELLGA